MDELNELQRFAMDVDMALFDLKREYAASKLDAVTQREQRYFDGCMDAVREVSEMIGRMTSERKVVTE